MAKQSSSFQRDIITSTLIVLLLVSGCDSMTTSDPPKTGFLITGSSNNDFLGNSVGTAGDINNDGYDDIIVGALRNNGESGTAYVIYGGPTSSLSNLDLSNITLDPATTGFMITAKNAGDYLGAAVQTAGDINNDGYDDIIIGASGENWYNGAAYVIYGGPKSSMSNIDLRLTVLDPLTTGFRIAGTRSSYLGGSVSTAGDINNDGYDDIIIGALKGKAAYVIYGGPKSSMSNIDLNSTTLDPATTGFMVTGNLFGSVSKAGDINKDGYSDIIIGAAEKNRSRGAAYVIYGGPKSSMSNLDLKTAILDPQTTGFVISGNANLDSLGSSVSTAGDINNDGYDDIIIGAYGKKSFTGAAYVIYGGPKSSISNIDLSSTTLDPATTGFMISGDVYTDYLGASVSRAGDINNDGFSDIIIGAWGKNFQAGAVYVIYGGAKPSMLNIDLNTTTLDPATTGFMFTGNDYARFGYSVSTAGDINHDGYEDMIIGCPKLMIGGTRGGAYVVYGGPKPSMLNMTF